MSLPDALSYLRQARRVACDAWPDDDTDTLRKVMRLVESARVALADEPAAAPTTPLRPAEEIAREMVVPTMQNRITGKTVVALLCGSSRVYVEVDSEGEADDLRRLLARLIEQRDAEHAAALAPQQPRDLAGRLRALVQEYAGRWADETDMWQRDILQDCMGWLRDALRKVRAGGDPIAFVKDLRSVGSRSATTAADDLEAIVRECGEAGRCSG